MRSEIVDQLVQERIDEVGGLRPTGTTRQGKGHAHRRRVAGFDRAAGRIGQRVVAGGIAFVDELRTGQRPHDVRIDIVVIVSPRPFVVEDRTGGLDRPKIVVDDDRRGIAIGIGGFDQADDELLVAFVDLGAIGLVDGGHADIGDLLARRDFQLEALFAVRQGHRIQREDGAVFQHHFHLQIVVIHRDTVGPGRVTAGRGPVDKLELDRVVEFAGLGQRDGKGRIRAFGHRRRARHGRERNGVDNGNRDDSRDRILVEVGNLEAEVEQQLVRVHRIVQVVDFLEELEGVGSGPRIDGHVAEDQRQREDDGVRRARLARDDRRYRIGPEAQISDRDPVDGNRRRRSDDQRIDFRRSVTTDFQVQGAGDQNRAGTKIVLVDDLRLRIQFLFRRVIGEVVGEERLGQRLFGQVVDDRGLKDDRNDVFAQAVGMIERPEDLKRPLPLLNGIGAYGRAGKELDRAGEDRPVAIGRLGKSDQHQAIGAELVDHREAA